MADKKEREYVNPKYLLRKMLESLPAELPEELTCTVLNLYAHSNGFLEKADVDAGVFTFTVTASFSQLAKVCHLTPKGMKKRLIRLRDDWHIASWEGKVESNRGNDYSIQWATGVPGVPEGWGTGDAEGGVLENRGGVLERQGGVLSSTPSVFSVFSGVKRSGDKLQCFIKQEDTDQNQEPNPRGVAPNPTGTSRPGTPGIDDSCMDAALPRPPAEQPCERGGLHEWREHTHTTDRCSECGTFRASPAVTQWTEVDDLEAEYMEMVECYDPYDTYWSAPEEPKSTAANRAALSPSEFARAIGAVAHWD
jgi:hypothetical protein